MDDKFSMQKITTLNFGFFINKLLYFNCLYRIKKISQNIDTNQYRKNKTNTNS